MQDVADAAFEYLLGLDTRLKARLRSQQAHVQAGALREEARFLAEQFQMLLAEQGWVGSLPSSGGDLSQVAERWAAQTLVEYVAEHFNYRFERENELLQGKLSALKDDLARPSGQRPSSGAVEATQRLIGLKAHRDGVQREIGALRSQLNEHAGVLSALEARWTSAKDLRRLKQDGLGILVSAECPTCQQAVSPEALKLDEQTAESIAENVASLERQRRVLKQGINRIHAELVAANAEDQSDADAIESAERALALTQHAVGAEREKAVKIATEIMEVERDMERNRRFQTRLGELQRSATAWIDRAKEVRRAEDDSGGSPPQIETFEQLLRQSVGALGIGGLDTDAAKKVRLGEHYEAMLGQRSLPAYGSASDRARLVMSYVLALLGAGTQHPGFVLLDEPIQQNPDDAHRARWVEHLCNLTPIVGRQIIVFTYLRPEEQIKLIERGVPLVALKGRFLALDPPPPDASQGGSAGAPGTHAAKAPDDVSPTGASTSSVVDAPPGSADMSDATSGDRELPKD